MDKDSYYFHNVKATVSFTVKNWVGFDWLLVSGNEFSVVENSKRYRFWGKTSYLPLIVLRNHRPWAELDVQRKKLHVITRGDFENQLQSFVDLLNSYSPDFSVEETIVKYVEICTRYLDKYFDDVRKHIIEAESRFFTSNKVDSIDKRIKGKTWLTLGRMLFIDKTNLNIKTYRFVNDITTKKRKISETILPKIEIQIYNPVSIENAQKEAIPIIKAFQKHIGFETEKMYESEYSWIQDTSSLSHNEKLFNCLKENTSVKAVKFPKEVTKDELTHKIACFITPEAKSGQEIMNYAHISRSTLQRVLNKLKPYLERRGNNAGLYYQFDASLVEPTNLINKGKNTCVIKSRATSNTLNKGNTSIIGVSTSKPSVYCPDIKVIGQKPKFHTVQITVEKQIVKDRTVTITILPQAVKFPNSLAKSSHLTIQNQLFEHKMKGGEYL